ncbi:MAG: fibronectin type III domain-containing protein [Chloroflexi bacterium]|nr:fibronectin type III domain-containing protein [Chloroflexota bacterium]
MKERLPLIAAAFLVLTLLLPTLTPVGAQSAPQIALVDPAPPTAQFGSGAPNVINATATSPGSTITSAEYQAIFNDPPGTFTALEIFGQVPIVPPDIPGAQNTGPDFTGQVPVGSAVLFVVFGQVTQKNSNFGGNPAITEWRIGNPPVLVYQTADTGISGAPVEGTEVRVVANRKVAPGSIVAEVIAQRPGGGLPNPPPPTVENAFLFNGTIESVEEGVQSAGFSIGGTVWNVRDGAGLLVPFRIDDPNLPAAVDPGIGLGEGLNSVVTVEFGIPLPTDVVENVGLEIFAQVPAGVPATRHQNPTSHLVPSPLQVPAGSWRLFVVFGTVTALDAVNGEWQIGQPPVFVYEAADGSTGVRQIFDPALGQNRAIAVGDGVKIVANRTLGPGPIVAEVITGQDAGPQPEEPPTMEGAFLFNGTVTLETATTWTVGGVVFTVTDAAIDAGLGAGVGEDPNVTVEFSVSGPPPPDAAIWAPLTLNTATNVHSAVLTPAAVAADRAGNVFLRATDANQQVTTTFANAILKAVATAVPAAPTGLRAVIASPTVVEVSWTDASSDEASFRVERAANSQFTNLQAFLVAANGTSFTDDTVPNNTAPFYRVFAVNGVGDSTAATAVQAATGAPSAPSALGGVVVSATRIDLTWTDSADNESGFRIERSTDGTSFTTLDTVAAGAAALSDTTVTAGGTYFYRVVAFNGAGDSAASNVLEMAVLAPAQPTALSATIFSTTQVDLTWTNNVTNATEFRIMRSTDGTNFTLLDTVAGPNVTTYSNTGLTAGDAFWYQVVAANSVGSSAPSTPVQVALTAPQVAPTLAGLAASPTQVNLTWTSAATNAAGFRIERSADGTDFTLLDTVVGGNVTAYSNTGLTLGDAFWYRVVATNVFGNSAPSNPVQVALTVPAPPILNAGAVSSTQVRLTWTSTATNATGFRIERSTGNSAFATLTTVGANASTHDDSALTPAVAYTYRIFAVNGVGDSPASEPRTVITPQQQQQQPAPTATPVPVPLATPTPIPTPTPVPPTPTPTPLPPVTPVAKKEGETTAVIRPMQQVKVELEDKTVITVPPAALPDTVQMKVRTVTEVELPKPVTRGKVRKAVEIEVFDDKAVKLGPTAILQPIVIEIPLSADDLAAIGDDPNNVELHRYEEGLGVWVKIGSELDLARKVVRAQLRHLSLFAVVVPAPVTQAQPTPTAAPPSAGGDVPGSSTWLVALVIGLGILLFGFRLLRGARQPIKKE